MSIISLLKKDGIRSIDRSDAVPIDVYNQNESAIEKKLWKF